MYPYLFNAEWLPSYMVMICVGIVAAFLCCKIVADKTDISYSTFKTLCLMFLTSILIGFAFARLFQALYNLISSGSVGTGITFFGGLIGGVAAFAVMYFIMRKKVSGSLGEALRMSAPSIAIAHSFGRIGCFLAGCCYGKKSDSFLSVTFPYGDGSGVPRIPTQLIEAIFLLVLFAVLLYFALKKKDTLCALVYCVGYSVFRFVIEFFRDDYRGGIDFFLSPSQVISVLVFVAAISYAAYYLIKKRNEP